MASNLLNMVKAYLKIPKSDISQDDFLDMLCRNVDSVFEIYTNIKDNENSKYDAVKLRMVVEDYNKYGSEGISSIVFGSNKESVLEDYSIGLQKQIRKFKRMRVL